ncbi:anthrone oxygenase family protein [Pantanalinema rosaneae CENA516]|uniref:anthrone oxygenase family protein n=1 Tax=Pantanalinema rosaneae TaxID=1620701 RepID=UPI003D6EB020
MTAILIAVAMAMALAHALELPGKMRLSKETYFAMQPIYYPGFTVGGGIGEFGGVIVTLILLILTPWGSTEFWLTLVALLGLLGMQGVYWLITHPVNQFWLEGENLSRFSADFFSFGVNQTQQNKRATDWTDLRNQWEYSHVIRTGFALVSLIAIVLALSMN